MILTIADRYCRQSRWASRCAPEQMRSSRSRGGEGAAIVIGMKLTLPILLCAAAWAQDTDVVVYGGTAGGAMTAIAAARQGLRVTLLEPGKHIGGIVSGGLSRTDVGRREVIGGYALEFYWRAGNAYNMAQHLQDIAWLPEPHVAEAILDKMLRDAGVTVLLNRRLRERDGVRKAAAR